MLGNCATKGVSHCSECSTREGQHRSAMDAEPKKREPESATDGDGSAMSALIAATEALKVLRKPATGATEEILNINGAQEPLAFAHPYVPESSHHDGEECDFQHSQLDRNTDNGHEGRQQDDKNYAQVVNGVTESVRSTEICSGSVNPIGVEGLSSSDATPSATANSGELSLNVRESSQCPTKRKPRRGVSKKTSKQVAERTSEHVPDGMYARTPEPTKQETPVQGRMRTPELAPSGRTQRLLERIRGRAPQPTIEHATEGTSSTATSSTNPQHHSVTVPASPNENTSKIPVKGNPKTLTSKNNGAASPANATPDAVVALPSAPKKNPENACHVTGAARIVSHSTNNGDLSIQECLSTAGLRAHSAHPGTADLTTLSARSQCRTSKRSVLKEILKQPHPNMQDTTEASRPFSRMWNALRGVSHRPSIQRQQTARNNPGFLARSQEGPTLNGAAKAFKCDSCSMKQELSLPIKTEKKRKTSLAWRFPTLRAILQRPPLNANVLPQDSEVSLTTPEQEYPSSYELVPTWNHGTSEAAILQSDCKENIPPLASELPSRPQHTAMSPERTLVVPEKRVPTPNSTTSVPGVIQASGRGNSSRRQAPRQTGRNQPTSDSHRQSASVSSTSHFREQQASASGSDTAQATSHEHGQNTQWDKDFQLMLRRYLPRELLECTAPRTQHVPQQQHRGQQSHTTEARGMSSGHRTQTVSTQSSTVLQIASVSSTTTFAQQQASAASSDPTSTMSQGDRKDPQWERDFQLMLRRYLPRELLECTSQTARSQPQGQQHQQQSDMARTSAESLRDSPWDKEFQRMLPRYLPRELHECTAPSARQPHEQLTETEGPSGASNEANAQRLADLCQAVRAKLFAESCLPWSAFLPGREPPQNQLLQKAVPSMSPVSNLTRMPGHNQAFDANLRAVHISQPSTSRAPLQVCQDSGAILLNQEATKPTSPKATSYREPAVSSFIGTETDGDDDDSMPDLETPSPVDSPVQPDAPSPQHSHSGLEQARAFEATSSSQTLPQAQPLHASQFVTLHPCRREPGNAPQTTQTLTRTTSSFKRPLKHQQPLQRRFHPAPDHERGHSTFSPTRMPVPAHRSAMQRTLLHGHSAPRSYFAPASDWERTSHPEEQHVYQAPLRGISPRQLSNVNLVPFRRLSQAFPRNQGASSSLTAYAMEGRIRRHSSHETEASRSQERSLKDLVTATRQSASEPDIYPLTPSEQSDASIGSTFKFAESTSFAMDLTLEPLGASKLETDEYKGAWQEHRPEPCAEGLQSSPADEKHDSKDRSATPQKRKPSPPMARSQSDEALETSEKKFQQSPSETPSSERYPLKLTLFRSKQRGKTRFTRKRPPKVEAEEEEEEQPEEPEKPGSSREPDIKPPGEEQPSEVQLGASLHPRARSLEALYFPERVVPPSIFYYREPPSDDRRSELRRFAEDIWPE